MRITTLKTEGLVSLPASVELGRITALTGPSGSGKSLLLKTLSRARDAVRPYGQSVDRLSELVDPRRPGGKLVMGFELDAFEEERFRAKKREDFELLLSRTASPKVDVSPALVDVLGAYGHREETGFFEYAPDARSVTFGGANLDPRHQRALRSSEAPEKYDWLNVFYCDVALQIPFGLMPAPTVTAVNDLFATAECGVRLAAVRREGLSYLPIFRSSDGSDRTLAALPSGEKQIALFVALLGLTRPKRSVLLIDAFERDLDARLQLGLLGLLAKGDNQVVFATHSERLPSSSMVDKVIELSGGAHGKAVVS